MLEIQQLDAGLIVSVVLLGELLDQIEGHTCPDSDVVSEDLLGPVRGLK